MNYYPYNAPIVLTDNIFVLFGGHTGSSVAAQRAAAYFIAERVASDDINTYLAPTIVTGTFLNTPSLSFILEQGYINRIIETRFLDEDEKVYYTERGLNQGHVRLLDDERGFVAASVYNFWGVVAYPYKIQFIYETGLPSGTAWRPDVLLGLVTYADIILNEIQGFGNEAPGDIGVTNYKNQQYYEQRVGLIRTSFGTSARAQFVHGLFTNLRKKRWVGL